MGKEVYTYSVPAVHGPRPRKLYASLARPQLLSGFVVNGHLPQVPCQLCLSVTDEGDNEVGQRAMHRSIGIYLIVEGNPRDSQLGGCMMKAVTSHHLSWDPLPKNGSSTIAQHIRDGEKKKGWREPVL